VKNNTNSALKEQIGSIKDVTYNIKKDLLEYRVVVGTMFRETELLDRIENSHKNLHPLEISKQAGFRFVVIDGEHKAFNQERIATYARIAHKIGISLWLRPTQEDEVSISKYADMGISGFMIPNAIELTRIHKIISQAYFEPIADKKAYIRRGYSIGEVLLDWQDFDGKIRQEMEYTNRNTIVVLQTEHQKGIRNLTRLFSISREGITGTIVGPNDLAINLSRLKGNGYLLECKRSEMYQDEVMLNAYELIGKIALDNKRVAGIHFTDKDQVNLIQRLIKEERFHKYRLILYGTERNLLEGEYDFTKEKVGEVLKTV